MLLDWLSEARIERLGCFKYEAVDGAAANDGGPHVPEEVKEERWHRLMAQQAQTASEILEAKVGREIDVLIDEIDVDEAVGRSQWDAPEIDGKVFLPNGEHLPVGEIIRAEVLGAEGYDLVARPV